MFNVYIARSLSQSISMGQIITLLTLIETPRVNTRHFLEPGFEGYFQLVTGVADIDGNLQ